MELIGYVRVSTARQAEFGYSLEAQRAAIRWYALERGWQVGWCVEAGKSARDLRRPALESALELLASHQADGLIVSRLDRLIRSLIDFGDLVELSRRQGWTLVCIDPNLDLTTATGELVANVIAAVAQWERQIIGQRVRECRAIGKAHGQVYGVPSRTPLATAERIHREHSEGKTVSQIARGLNEEGVPTAYGTGWWYIGRVVAVLGRPVQPPGAPPLQSLNRTGLGRLTRREWQVCALLARGKSNAAIGLELGLSPDYVQHYITDSRRKLGLSSRKELASIDIGPEPISTRSDLSRRAWTEGRSS